MERKFEGIWIPAALYLRKDLTSSEKFLLLDIQSLDNDFGCTASNKFLDESSVVSIRTITRLIKSLEDKGLIEVTYSDFNTFEGRVIRMKSDIHKPVVTHGQDVHPPHRHDVEGYRHDVEGYRQDVLHTNTYTNTYTNNKLDKESNLFYAESDFSSSDKKEKPLNPPKKTKAPKPKKEKEVPPEYVPIVDFWLKQFHIDWTFGATHGKMVKEIIGKIRDVMKKTDGQVITPESVVDAFKLICNNLPEYYKNKDLQVLNSKFNEIITEIRNQKHGKPRTTTNYSRQSTYDTAAAEFGSFR